MTSLEDHRAFYTQLITAGLPENPRLVTAFATVPRERFVGPGPWQILTASGPEQTPTNDPAFLYQDALVALAPERRINNGQPSLHALCLSALNVKDGERVLHIGAGTGYYTAVLSELVGPTGEVIAYEIEEDLAESAAENLIDRANVKVLHRSGAEGRLPDANVVYVNAGASAPLNIWLDALRPGGRLLFPLIGGREGTNDAGGMLLVTRCEHGYPAKFISGVSFIPCIGASNEQEMQRLWHAFRRGDAKSVQSLRRGTAPAKSCWFAGEGWWLSRDAAQR
jgi:protein-L-isoaspartate(D-aspartate) O-methyltransferase